MPVLPGNYGSAENLKRRNTDSMKRIRFDFTVNIPTIVTVLILAGTILGWAKTKYESFDLFIAQHNAMWDDYIKTHPDALKYVRK